MNSKFTVISVSLASMMPDFPYIQTINDSTIIWINDVFNQKDLLKLLQDRNPAYIVSDHLSTVEHLPYQIYSAPMFLADTTRLIVNNLPGYQNFETRKNFNFIINKKNINRYLCLKLVEMFQLKNFNYTWSGVDKNFDLANIISEVKLLGSNSPLNQDQFSMLMHPVNITPYFIDAPKNNTNNSFIIYQNNSWTWNHGLNDIFSSSAVSLITESLRFQKNTLFTEKTAYALLGKTFPIWVGGGINQAKEFESMGFDAFHDVIDHSYQDCATLIERCFYAFKRNLHLLTDFEYVRDLRTKFMDRLEHNRNLLINRTVDRFCIQRISKWPNELQEAIKDEYYVKNLRL